MEYSSLYLEQRVLFGTHDWLLSFIVSDGFKEHQLENALNFCVGTKNKTKNPAVPDVSLVFLSTRIYLPVMSEKWRDCNELAQHFASGFA